MHEENNLILQNTHISYRKMGRGPCVILVHGFSEDGEIWNKQSVFLQNYFQLIIPDLSGSGKSGLIPQLSIEGHAEIIHQIIVHEKIEHCVMIGHSMGGYITLAFAEKFREKLQAFTLFHSTAYADSEEKIAMRIKSIDFIKKFGSAEFIKQSSPNLFADETKSNHPEMIQVLINKYNNFNPNSLVSYYKAMITRPDRTSVLSHFKKPIQFIIGEKDIAVPLEQSLRQCHIPEISYIHILEGTGHMGMWEKEGKANHLLLAFINSVMA